MILLTLAAGLGTRAQIGKYVPKALIRVKDKPLVYWSIDSLHPLRTCGLISNEKIFVGVRKSDMETFEFEKLVKEHINTQIQIRELLELTNGPAESAYLVIKALVAEGKINTQESILINDCDHHFNGNRLLLAAKKLEESDDSRVLLCTTSKNPIDLSWSFVREEEGVIIGVVEKPADHSDRKINFSEGLIGTYGFSKVADFLHLYEEAVKTIGNSEIFISRVIDQGITERYLKYIDKVFIDNFTSLGTAELIDRAIQENLLGGEFKESGTIFLDLDGTIFNHDSGGGIGEFSYRQTPTLVSEGIPQWLQSIKAFGYSIVITSARHEKSRKLLEDQLAAFSIPYDELLLALSGGPRFIFNDTKSSLACFPTAYAFNYPRNAFPVNQISSAMRNIGTLSIHDEFLGESGERTFLLKSRDGFIVRKQSQNNESSRSLISYQFRWFQTVAEFLPDSIPVLKSSNISSHDDLKYFDTEYIPDLVPLGDHLNAFAAVIGEQKIADLIQLLSELYSRFYKSTTENFSEFADVIEDKSLAGVVKGFNSLNISRDIPITGFVNGKPIDDSWKNISMVLDKRHKFNVELLKREKHIRTLIHGDPTLSNVTTNFAGNIYLLDPIGTRVLPSHSLSTDGLGRTHPIFDLSRVNLSIEHQYERWANDIVVSNEGPEPNYSLQEHPGLPALKPLLDKIWPKDFSPREDALIDLVYITTLARIFPYKAKTKKKEAFYLLGLLNEKCKKYIEQYM